MHPDKVVVPEMYGYSGLKAIESLGECVRQPCERLALRSDDDHFTLHTGLSG